MNKRQPKLFCIAGFSLATLAIATTASADPTLDRLLASQCAQCHGTDGRAVGDMDSLAGESFQEIYEELLEMKNSNDTGDIMHRQARGYSDAQIWSIADYFSRLPGGGDDDDD